MQLNLISPINNLGYGYTGLHVCEELIKLGHEVALFPIGNPECHPRHTDNIRQALANADQFSTDAPCVRLWHQHDMSMFVGYGMHIGFPIFELDTFTAKEQHHLQSCNELFVCSNWAKGIVEQHYITSCNNTNVVPLGVDSEIFYPAMSKRKPTIFLNVGKWEKRKGHDILIEAFQSAFINNENVELWMMCDNPFPQAQDFVKECVNTYKQDSRVRLIPRVESDEQVADVMRQADCGVFPSRAEGWNLEALEMLSCGKQVIATDYSAHTEFLTEENSWLVSINDVEPAKDGVWFSGQGNWGKITNESMEDLIQHMRYVHNTKQSGQLELNKKGIETAQRFSWKNTAEKIISYL